MRWIKRLLFALPFAIATVLNVLMVAADRLHLYREHIAGYGFLFAAPWAWLLDRGWLPQAHNGWLGAFVGYSIILWIPAALYSGGLWLLIAGIKNAIARGSDSATAKNKVHVR